jgi:protein SCO1/2
LKTLTFILLLSWAAVAAQPTLPDIGIEEQLGAYIPTELYFVDDKGDSIALKDRLQRPVVLSLVYYRCPGICSNILTGLADVVDRVDLVSGIDYDIWTISFNHAENWELGAKKKVNYMNLLEKKYRSGFMEIYGW